MVYISAAFVAAFLLSMLFSSRFLRALCVVPPAFLSYCLLFRANKMAEDDFERRIWHAERMRGLRAGSDVDGDGKVTDEERTRESAEWANAVVRGLWPIINPDMFSSLVDMLEDIMQSSVPTFIVRLISVASHDSDTYTSRPNSILSASQISALGPTPDVSPLSVRCRTPARPGRMMATVMTESRD